jgi:hypothetical protein
MSPTYLANEFLLEQFFGLLFYKIYFGNFGLEVMEITRT